MSYSIYLKDPVTYETAVVPGHLMVGGTYKADYDLLTNSFTPALNTEASLNITYNYSKYYYEVYQSGIREIYGKTGLESIPQLETIVENIKNKYMCDGKWVVSKIKKVLYHDKDNNIINSSDIAFGKKGFDDIDAVKEVEYEIDEGDTSDYWKATAANALRPIHQLIALAKMRPDCIWDGD